MKLSILIPTLNEPESIEYLRRLTRILDPEIEIANQYGAVVEKCIHDAGRSMPTGQKRNELIHNSTGEYFSFIDCDDVVPGYYVREMLTAIDQNPDVVTFIGFMTTDGMHKRNFTIKLGESYEERDAHYYRYPNHLCCFKRSAVEHIKFQSIWVQEDYKWATEIMKKKLLKTEVHIPRTMYHYDFKNRKRPHHRNTTTRL